MINLYTQEEIGNKIQYKTTLVHGVLYRGYITTIIGINNKCETARAVKLYRDETNYLDHNKLDHFTTSSPSLWN